jgi:hypothetical protein
MTDDPINHRDPTGRKINVSKIDAGDLLELLVQLSELTGLSVGVCGRDEACDSGELVVRGSASGGSSIARDILLDAIADPSVISVESKNRSDVGFGRHPVELNYPGEGPASPRTKYSGSRGSRRPTNFAEGRFELDFADFRAQRSKSAKSLSARRVGYTFFHELLHHVSTGSYRDQSELGVQYTTLGDPKLRVDRQPGDIEDIVNEIRGQMHVSQRTNYFEIEGSRPGERCLEFSDGQVCWDSAEVDQ